MWTPYFNFDMFDLSPGHKNWQFMAVMQDPEIRGFAVQFILGDIRLMRSEIQFLLSDIRSDGVIGAPFNKISKIGFTTNDEEKVESIIFLTENSNPVEAIRWCYNPVCQILSHWSFQNGGSFAINGVKVQDTKHHMILRTKSDTGVSAIAPVPMFMPERFDLDERHRAMLSLYRECRNSSSPFYSLLCSYKIMEAVFKDNIFADIDMAIKDLGIEDERSPGEISEGMLMTARAHQLHENYVRMNFKDFMGKITRSRNGVAHALLRKGDMYDFDHIEHYTEVAITASLADLVAREILAEELRLIHVIDAAHAEAEGKKTPPVYFRPDRFIYPKIHLEYQEEMWIDVVKRDSHGNMQE